MIPIALVTGFLGSGKTTFLRRLSRAHAGRRLAYIVNDFASVDVDAQALSELDGEMVSLPGGSIFCRCLATPFTGALRRLAAMAPVLEGVVVEASGMADPRAVGDLLAETRLDRHFTLASVVAMADPATFHKLLATLPAIRSQVEASDVVLLNKSDLHAEVDLLRTEEALRGVRADVPILRCARAEADVALFQGTSHALHVHAPLAPCRDTSFCSAHIPFDSTRPVDARDLCTLLNRYAAVLLRAKGFVPTARGLVEIQWTMNSPGSAAILAGTPRGARPGLALIVQGGAEEALDELVRCLQ